VLPRRKEEKKKRTNQAIGLLTYSQALCGEQHFLSPAQPPKIRQSTTTT
jgi:hypothetical protein